MVPTGTYNTRTRACICRAGKQILTPTTTWPRGSRDVTGDVISCVWRHTTDTVSRSGADSRRQEIGDRRQGLHVVTNQPPGKKQQRYDDKHNERVASEINRAQDYKFFVTTSSNTDRFQNEFNSLISNKFKINQLNTTWHCFFAARFHLFLHNVVRSSVTFCPLCLNLQTDAIWQAKFQRQKTRCVKQCFWPPKQKDLGVETCNRKLQPNL